MVIAGVIVAATMLLSVLILSAIAVRPKTPCLFDGTIVFTAARRYDGGKCTGKADNVYMSGTGATQQLHGTRSCNGHLSRLMDVADQLVREAA